MRVQNPPLVCLRQITAITSNIKGAVTDMRYFGRSKFSRSLVHKKNFSSSFQFRIDILSGEVGYLLSI